MRKLVLAGVLAVCGAIAVVYALAVGTDPETGTYGTVQAIALAAGFLAFVGGTRHLIATVRGIEA